MKKHTPIAYKEQIRTMKSSLPHTETEDDIPLNKYDFRENY
jgi:hypothetical protein